MKDYIIIDELSAIIAYIKADTQEQAKEMEVKVRPFLTKDCIYAIEESTYKLLTKSKKLKL
jgi:hypothetical protein